MTEKKTIWAGLLGLALTVAMAQGAEPTIDYAIKMEITYTGVLYQSTDGENWTKVEGAASPYYVPMDEAKKLFFCSKEEELPPEPPAPGKNITVSLSDMVDLDLNWIEPGTFMMGSPTDELGRYDDETQHQVILTQGYWLGKYEVTQAQYEAVMGTNPSDFKGADLPVEQVSWNDAVKFCEWLTAQERAAGRLPEGYEYTLPTEAQWEYACRAGTTTALNSGKNLSNSSKCSEMDEVGWYKYNSDETTHPVGQKLPNAWGLYDMHGNVWEWCLDWYGAYPTSSVTDPKGPSTGSRRVVRGGSWYNLAGSCRSANRGNGIPSDISYSRGFRVALSLVQ